MPTTFILRTKFFLSFFLLAVFSAGLSLAVPPPPGFPIPSQKTCRINPSASNARAAAIKGAPFFPANPLSPTTSYIFVIRVDFSDKTMTTTKSDADSFFDRLHNFYLENSYGMLSVSATVTTGGLGVNGAYRLSATNDSLAQGICSNYSDLAQSAVNKAIAGGYPISSSTLVMIYHAGIGAETAGDGGCQTKNFWSVYAPTVSITSPKSEGVRENATALGSDFHGVTVVPESEAQNIDPLGVICHEFGHQIGLPDLYKSPSDSVEGKWSLMDSGVYLGSPLGSNPSHLDAWSKQFLGFFKDPQYLTATDNGSSVPMELALSSANAFLRIPIQGVANVNGNKEYFLIERRALSSVTGRTYDNALPFGSLNAGYLIWHIDDNIAMDESRLAANNINNGSPNFAVDLVEAGGKGVVTATQGSASDPFPGSLGMTLFAAPHSNAFNGLQSGVVVSGFNGSSLFVKKAYASSSVDIARVINYPNPGGPSYGQKSGAPAATVTTIVVQATRPPGAVELTIHDLSGMLIRKASQSELAANGQAVSSNKFVYEYNWDGKNKDGETCAPGVYLYRFRLDESTVKTGKLVLVR